METTGRIWMRLIFVPSQQRMKSRYGWSVIESLAMPGICVDRETARWSTGEEIGESCCAWNDSWTEGEKCHLYANLFLVLMNFASSWKGRLQWPALLATRKRERAVLYLKFCLHSDHHSGLQNSNKEQQRGAYEHITQDRVTPTGLWGQETNHHPWLQQK